MLQVQSMSAFTMIYTFWLAKSKNLFCCLLGQSIQLCFGVKTYHVYSYDKTNTGLFGFMSIAITYYELSDFHQIYKLDTRFAAPQNKNAVCALHIIASYFLFLSRNLAELRADDQFAFIIKGSIYYIKHVLIHLFIIRVDWSVIACLIEVSAMIYEYTYFVLLCTEENLESPFEFHTWYRP